MVYLDHNASSPLDQRVLEAMLPYLGKFFGNPSSLHRQGRIARSAIDTARQQVAALVSAQPSQIIFTSGGTEANNLAIKGLAAGFSNPVFAIGATEHPSISAPAQRLADKGWLRHSLEVDFSGSIRADSLQAVAQHKPDFVSVMLANNETGVIQNLAPLVEKLKPLGTLIHSDAVQAAGKIEVDFAYLGLDLLTLSSHKIYGPKGAGALVVASNVKLEPLLEGGGQEADLRSGTENVAAIVGFGKAAELAKTELQSRTDKLQPLRTQLESYLSKQPSVTLFAKEAQRLPNTLQFALSNMQGEALLMALDRKGFAVSSGSACASGAGEPSPVLLAMGYDEGLAKNAIRVSLGKDNERAEIDRLIATLASLIQP